MVTEAHEASSKLIEQLELEPITLPALNRQPRLLLLEKEVAERITVWRDWTPAGTRPYPSYSSKDKLDDFYGVLAGTKPAAYQVWRHHVPLPQIVAILKVAESLDYSVRAWEIEDQGDLMSDN
jgi:hypothetical protein